MSNITETPVIQKETIKLSRSVIAMNSVHQPIIVAVDNSASMQHIEDDSSVSNLQLAENMVNQIGLDERLSLADQQVTDFCVLNFHDIVEVKQNWIPLSQYERNIKLSVGGCTAFYSAVTQSLLACKELFTVYKTTTGINCKRPQIFIFTDGFPTDDENADTAKQLCKRYLEGEHPECRLHVILMPGASSKAVKSLSSAIRIYALKDCTHGLPTALDFINSSVVTFSSTAIGADYNLTMNARYMTPAAGQGKVNSQTATAIVGDTSSTAAFESSEFLFAS